MNVLIRRVAKLAKRNPRVVEYALDPEERKHPNGKNHRPSRLTVQRIRLALAEIERNGLGQGGGHASQ